MKRTLMPEFVIASTLLLIASPVILIGTAAALALRKRLRGRQLVP